MRKISTRLKPRPNAKLNEHALAMLDRAEWLLVSAKNLDTAPRDVVAEGLAYIVYAAFDTLAIAECISNSDLTAYIHQRTYMWFRNRGFLEWFCAGASTLFRTSDPVFFRESLVTQLKGGKGVRIKRGAAV